MLIDLTDTDTLAADSVVIRRATDTDIATLARLAALDTAALPSGEVLVAEVGGETQAAVEVASGTVIADPFRPTAHLADLLRIRAARLREEAQAPRWARAYSRAATGRRSSSAMSGLARSRSS